MSEPREVDAVGVGLGPFNLGLAALLEPLPEIEAMFLEARPGFSWHPGLMLPETTVQVPFLADLVTLADPTSRHSFLNYLHEQGRLYRFYFLERLHLLRAEFEDYCRWVAGRLPSCRFGRRVEAVRPAPGGGWSVEWRGAGGEAGELRARAVVFGVGTRPWVPECAAPALGREALHSSDYLGARERLHAAGAVTVVGSGQSAAEVFLDLLQNAPDGARRDWFTRSAGFLPMEYSKLGLEHFSPEYGAHFHSLPAERRDALRAGQDLLYKGISAETSAQIYDLLYRYEVEGGGPAVGYRARCELRSLEAEGGGLRLGLRHLDQDRAFDHRCDALVLATGYREAPLPLPDLAELVETDALGRPAVDLDYRLRLRDGRPSTLFVQNAELHTHGVGAPDLGLGAHRSAVIANALAGRPVYRVRARNVYQRFGAPEGSPE